MFLYEIDSKKNEIVIVKNSLKRIANTKIINGIAKIVVYEPFIALI